MRFVPDAVHPASTNDVYAVIVVPDNRTIPALLVLVLFVACTMKYRSPDAGATGAVPDRDVALLVPDTPTLMLNFLPSIQK